MSGRGKLNVDLCHLHTMEDEVVKQICGIDGDVSASAESVS
jgi:hypothetical protein